MWDLNAVFTDPVLVTAACFLVNLASAFYVLNRKRIAYTLLAISASLLMFVAVITQMQNNNHSPNYSPSPKEGQYEIAVNKLIGNPSNHDTSTVDSVTARDANVFRDNVDIVAIGTRHAVLLDKSLPDVWLLSGGMFVLLLAAPMLQYLARQRFTNIRRALCLIIMRWTMVEVVPILAFFLRLFDKCQLSH